MATRACRKLLTSQWHHRLSRSAHFCRALRDHPSVDRRYLPVLVAMKPKSPYRQFVRLEPNGSAICLRCKKKVSSNITRATHHLLYKCDNKLKDEDTGGRSSPVASPSSDKLLRKIRFQTKKKPKPVVK